MSEVIKIDQTLHGYANGHSLLQSSIGLSNVSQRLMLGLSDMSGPGMRIGFDSYLTAYALDIEQAYVIARTWYAPEMQRPGCVWTHSLLVKYADIPKITDIRTLMGLFKRPDSLVSNTSFSEQLTYDTKDNNLLPDLRVKPPWNTADVLLLKTILYSLYQQPEKPVYIIASNVHEHESMIIQLWSQQWPQLRKTFSFCTGTLANRLLRGKSLDLQVVPKEAISELRKDLAKGVVVDATSPMLPNDLCEQEWIDEAIQDIIVETSDRKREIAWSLTDSQLTSRSSFPAVFYFTKLVQKQRSKHLNAEQYIKSITTVPASINVPVPLLKTILKGEESNGPSTLSEYDLLRALATVSIGDLLKIDDLDIDGRVNRLWQTNKKSALSLFSELFVQDNATEVCNRIFHVISNAIQPEDLENITLNRPATLNVLVGRNPSLATTPAVWQARKNDKVEIFHSLMSANIDEIILKQVVGAILLSDSENIAEQAYFYGSRLITPILDWINSDSSETYNLSEAWTRYLRSQPDTIVSWLQTHTPIYKVLNLLSTILAADSLFIDSLELRLWTPLLNNLVVLNKANRIPVAAFLFALGFKQCAKPSMEFMCDSFEIVHDAAANGVLDYDYWRPIAAKALPIVWWREWDKCERMRAALLDRFIACDWPNIELLSAVSNVSTLDKLFSLSKTTQDRKRFLRQTAKIGLKTDISLDCRRVLENYI